MQFNATIAADAVNAFFMALNAQVPVAQTAAIKASVETANEIMMAVLAQDSQLPVTVLSHRVFTDTSGPVGKVWIGTLPIDTDYLQPIKASGHGATAGPFYFDGAFTVNRNGKTSLYRRVAKNRYPIQHVLTNELPVNGILGNPVEQMQDTYMQVFIDKLAQLND